MSALASLVRAYERLPNAPAFGYSTERIGFLVSLNADGSPAGPPIDLRAGEGKSKRKTPRLMQVPASFKRPGTTPRSFFLWDNTAFALGVSASEKKAGATRLEAFRQLHRKELTGTDDPGLKALLCFIDSWSPADFARLGWPEEMKDQNIVFALESERLKDICIHDRPAARALWTQLSAEGEKKEATCLITGERGPIARLHPPIKGIRSPGGGKDADSIVSFNLPAFNSYGHEQGENAPVSEAAAFAYTTALNRFLERGSGHRIQIGDASTVFWADASEGRRRRGGGRRLRRVAWCRRGGRNRPRRRRSGPFFRRCARDGRSADFSPDLGEGRALFVLGLAPNAA